MRAGFFVIAFAIVILINSYVVVRGWHALPPASVLRPIYLISMIVSFLILVVNMVFAEHFPEPIAKVISFVGFTYVIVFVYLMLSFLMVDIIRVANYFIHFLPDGMAAFRLWAMAATLGLITIALIIGNYKFNHPSIVTLNISSDKPKQNKEIKIVAVSDLHVGISIDKIRLQSYVKLINDQHPDIVLMAGDVSDRSMIPVKAQHMDEEFRSIKARLGVFAINGNHEHYAEEPNETANYLRSAGITELIDSVCLVDNSFYIVGREDRSNPKRKNLSDIVNGLDKNLPKILMDHQPFHLEDAEKNNVDFQISGHTHNGQFFPGNLVVKRMYELGYGFMKKGSTNYFVSSGLGLWGPHYRIGTQSELVVVNFKY